MTKDELISEWEWSGYISLETAMKMAEEIERLSKLLADAEIAEQAVHMDNGSTVTFVDHGGAQFQSVEE